MSSGVTACYLIAVPLQPLQVKEMLETWNKCGYYSAAYNNNTDNTVLYSIGTIIMGDRHPLQCAL